MHNSDRPNIVVINPDQMRWDYASCYGHPFIATSNIDALAASGTRFEHAFTAAPACGPSRASFLTGRYPCEHGVRSYGGDLDLAHPNALTELGRAGYRRAIWGKDHVFKGDVIGSIYDEGQNICMGVMGDHPDYKRAWDTGVLEPDSSWNTTRRFTDAGLDFIRRNADSSEPFFLTLNFQDPHPFFACPEPYASLFDPDQFSPPENYRTAPSLGEIRRLTHWRTHARETEMPEGELRKAMAVYCGQIRYVDDQVGRVMSLLDELNLLERTIVMFWSDHGEFIGDFGVTHKLPAFYECLVRVPLIIKDPTGRLAGGVHTHIVELMDAMAGVLDLCGVPQPAGSRARSILGPGAPRSDAYAEGGLQVRQPGAPDPSLTLKAAQPPTNYGPGAMLRTDRWKLCVYGEDEGELFDLERDPLETENLYSRDEHKDVRLALSERLTRRMLGSGQAPEDFAERH